MKHKKIVCALLSLSLLCGNMAMAFTDITSPEVQKAAAVLSSLHIMQGDGGGQFQPNAPITRAEFAKIAVTALGVTDVSAYRNYSIFPDVPASFWGAGYINAALKQPSIAEKKIIRGFADGKFGPNRSIRYGEVCTMLLRMLGYTVDDVGAFWPTDYISKAESLGLRRGVRAYGPYEEVVRGDIAVMILNTLQAPPAKEGNKMLMNLVASSTVEDSILLATGATDSELRREQARFYENGSTQVRSLAQTLDASLIGLRGTILFDKQAPSKVYAFVPQTTDAEVVTVKQAFADGIDIGGQKLTVPSKTPVVTGGNILEYGVAWPDLTTGYQLNVFYDAAHQVELLSSTQLASPSSSFVYGVANSMKIPSGYKIMKNGVEISAHALRPYDLVSLNEGERKATVSDRRVTGYLRSASPNFAHPSRISVLGHEFTISDAVANYFKGMQYNDKITLLLDVNGVVQAAYPASTVQAENIGIFNANASGTATVHLLSGVSVSGTLADATSEQLLGKLVQVSEERGGKLSLRAFTNLATPGGEWTIASHTLGSRTVSPQVKIYETVDTSAPVTIIGEQDITMTKVPSADIRGVLTDSAGTVTAIFLRDVTGLGWQYGLAYADRETNEEGQTQYRITFKTWENGAMATKHYQVQSLPADMGGTLIGIPRGLGTISGVLYTLPVQKLEPLGTIDRNAFDGERGVTLPQGYLNLPSQVAVYAPKLEKIISLREAKLNYTSFTVYGTTQSPQGARVAMLLAR